jgi:pyruvate ferredoxin oxidoreductase gamma subunit
MYRIRFHGRGGQGIQTAGRILGTAFLREGFEIQDVPLYGAERRGAPLFAYVRAAHKPINERGMIRTPDLVVVADDTLLAISAAEVLLGVTPQTVLLIDSVEPAPVWQQRLNFPGQLLVLPAAADVEGRAAMPSRGVTYASAAARLYASAAARLIGLRRGSLEQAIREELADTDPAIIQRHLAQALAAYGQMAAYTGIVGQGEMPPQALNSPSAWVEPPLDDVGLAALDSHGATPAFKSGPLVADPATGHRLSRLRAIPGLCHFLRRRSYSDHRKPSSSGGRPR